AGAGAGAGARAVRRADVIAACALACAYCGCAGSAARDSVPVSHDVRVADPAAAPAGGALSSPGGTPGGGSSAAGGVGYEYVAHRPLAVVALAESRGLAPAVARQAVDRLADALDVCATERARRGAAVPGAARVVAPIDPTGSVGVPSVRIDPGPGVAESAVVCLVAPVRLLTFPPVDAGARGIAVEALWGRLVAPDGSGVQGSPP
ncbi:MAG: hypothetical protein JOZ69_19335, partial [Myxococcales bacterium]|nr:hypothetical protein [Myxococcales bacterium]